MKNNNKERPLPESRNTLLPSTSDTESNGLESEAEIVWLHPPERYSYLRESTGPFSQRHAFPARMKPSGGNTDGGSGTHLVAYAVLKDDAPSSWGVFMRRYWWVKTYDRWEGHGTDRGTFYEKGGPVEAVTVESIHAGQPSMRGWTE